MRIHFPFAPLIVSWGLLSFATAGALAQSSPAATCDDLHLVPAPRECKAVVSIPIGGIGFFVSAGKNADDARIEQYCSITRKVALDTQTTLVDLRRACIAYLQNSNAQLRVDGTLYFRSSGLLTYDGVHPSSAGVSLLANLLSDGLCRALAANP